MLATHTWTYWHPLAIPKATVRRIQPGRENTLPLYITDSNYLQDPDERLLSYLRASRANRIALSEHVLIEMHKTEPQITVTRSLAQARQYAEQVVLLRGSPHIYGKALRTGTQVRAGMIDTKQSRLFGKWYDDVLVGSPEIMTHLAEMQVQAVASIADIGSTIDELLPTFQLTRKRFTKEELAEIRSRNLKSRSTQDKLIRVMFDMSNALFNRCNIPEQNRPHLTQDGPHYYLFRYAMCMTMLFTRWVYFGNLSPDRDKQINHVIDMHLCAEATFFDGILSKDKGVDDVHRQSRTLLRLMRGYISTRG